MQQSGRPAAPGSLTFLDSRPEVGRDRVLAATRTRRYRPGESVVRQGDEAGSLFLLEEGRLVVRFTTATGETVILTVLVPGDVFGEMGVLVDRHERTASAEALGEATVRMLRRDDFERLRGEFPGVNDFLLQVLAKRSDRLSRQLAEAHYLAVDSRLARRLFEVGRQFVGDTLPVVIPLTQEEIAQLAGTTRPTANHELRKLEADGIVRLERGRVMLLDIPALRRRCQLT